MLKRILFGFVGIALLTVIGAVCVFGAVELRLYWGRSEKNAGLIAEKEFLRFCTSSNDDPKSFSAPVLMSQGEKYYDFVYF